MLLQRSVTDEAARTARCWEEIEGAVVQLATVLGQVVSTVKDPGLGYLPLLLLACTSGIDGTDDTQAQGTSGPSYIAVDLVGAGVGEVVLVTTGSAARAAIGLEHAPVDAAVVGIADSVVVDGRRSYSKAG
ncbi:MAG: EutN/CcmL family microcompartment protein [Janthinobacterium lividum]